MRLTNLFEKLPDLLIQRSRTEELTLVMERDSSSVLEELFYRFS